MGGMGSGEGLREEPGVRRPADGLGMDDNCETSLGKTVFDGEPALYHEGVIIRQESSTSRVRKPPERTRHQASGKTLRSGDEGSRGCVNKLEWNSSLNGATRGLCTQPKADSNCVVGRSPHLPKGWCGFMNQWSVSKPGSKWGGHRSRRQATRPRLTAATCHSL